MVFCNPFDKVMIETEAKINSAPSMSILKDPVWADPIIEIEVRKKVAERFREEPEYHELCQRHHQPLRQQKGCPVLYCQRYMNHMAQKGKYQMTHQDEYQMTNQHQYQLRQESQYQPTPQNQYQAPQQYQATQQYQAPDQYQIQNQYHQPSQHLHQATQSYQPVPQQYQPPPQWPQPVYQQPQVYIPQAQGSYVNGCTYYC